MKFYLLATLVAMYYSVNGQINRNGEIDTSNYYNYFSDGEGLKGKKLTNAWLSRADVVPVLLEELRKAEFGLSDTTVRYKIDSVQTVTLAAYSKRRNIGFLYSGDHNISPSRKHRQHITLKKYIVFEDGPSGEADFITIEKSPENIIILNPDLYWYQFTDNPLDNSKLVTKQVALEILRMDIKMILKNAKRYQ